MRKPSRTNNDLLKENTLLKQRIQKLEISEAELKLVIDGLRKSEDRYRTLVENASDIVCRTDGTGHFTFVNQAALHLVGYEEEEVIGKHYLYFVRPDMREEANRFFGRQFVKGIPNTYSEYPLLTKEGHEFWIGQNTQLIEEDGYAKGFQAVARNITDRKQTEKALRKSEIKFRTIFESFEDIYYQTDLNNIITMISPSVYRLSGWKPEELIGQPVTLVYDTPQDRLSLLKAIAEQGYLRDYELLLKKRDGSQVMASLSAHLLYDASGAVSGVAGSLRDITERKKMEEALRRSEGKYHHLVDSINQGIFVAQDGMLKFVNPMSIKIIGHSEHALMTKPFIEFIHPDDRDVVLDNHMRRLSGEKLPTKYEFRIVTAEGNTRWTEIDSIIIPWDGKPASLAFHSDITERRRAEEMVNYQRRLLWQVIDADTNLIFVKDKEGRYMLANKAIAYTHGISPAAMIGKTDADLGAKPDEAIKRQKDNLEVLKTGCMKFIAEESCTRPSGEVHYYQTMKYPLEDDTGKQSMVLAVAVNITERKQMEENLLESEEKYRILLEESSDPIFSFTPEGQYKYVNRAFAEGVGKPIEDIIGKRIWDVFSKEEADKRFAPLSQVFRMGVEKSIEVRVPRAEGDRYYVTTITPIKNTEGDVVSAICSSKDITDRKHAEEALRESEELFTKLVNTIPDIIARTDLEGKILFVNDYTLQISGYKWDEVEGQSLLMFIAPEDREKMIKNMLLVTEGKSRGPNEYQIIMKDGRKIPFEVHGGVLHNKKGIPFGLVSECRNISERKSLEERLKRAEKMEALGQLAGGVAHDLNNVLGVLTGYSELLLLEIPEGQRTRSYVEKILKSTEKGAAIIQDLLTLARRGVTVSDVININEVISIFLKTPVFEKIKDYHPRVIFRTECDKNLLNIKGSPVHMEKTLMNLVANAAESISGQGEVTIRTQSCYLDKAIKGYDEVKEGEYAILAVSDTGMGIPAENIEKIFEPFYTKKTMGRSGTGLGLAIVWGTVKDHNGYINVQTNVGEGTTFTLFFPVTREELTATCRKMPVEQYTGNGESILVVDDIVEQRDVASGLLTRLGYKVYMVSSGEEAVEYLKENKTDILVLDMIMAPGIDGLETYQRVLAVNPKQKAIIVSGFSETDRVREAQKLGAGAYVKKPYMMEDIGMAIRDELRR